MISLLFPSLRNDANILKGAKQGTGSKPAKQIDEYPHRYDDLKTTIKREIFTKYP